MSMFRAGNRPSTTTTLLGRTAVADRFEKNEEDRLLMFMRRAAASESTLFVLTTREYILQQATQLYERLAIEGIEGRKFLLELRDYSRLDRARIFYNHAFFSGQLSATAKRGLLRDRAYERIVDHSAYNPRQIEWITGLSGHRLTDKDNDDYVAFALAALNDPARIWRHGFEEQLDATQRALLLTIESLPDQIEENDLEEAFLRHCGVADLSTQGRAFERALAVLDDSFVHIYHDEGRVFIRFHDPSVDDFLAGYLRASAADALAVVRGAVFFEQVAKLERIISAANTPLQVMAEAYVDAIERCFDSRSCSWWAVYYGRDATEPRTTRRDVSAEDRAEFVGRMRSRVGATLWRRPARYEDP